MLARTQPPRLTRPEPERIVREMCRVVGPGGHVVAVEPDSEILLVDSGMPDVTRRVLAYRAAGYANPWSGRQLRRLLHEGGLTNVTIEVQAGDQPSLAAAQERLHLLGVASAAVAAGVITEDERRSWEADLVERDQKASFTCIVLMVIGAGQVPRP